MELIQFFSMGKNITLHDGKVGSKTAENTTAFLYSDWLYILWHGKNHNMFRTAYCRGQ